MEEVVTIMTKITTQESIFTTAGADQDSRIASATELREGLMRFCTIAVRVGKKDRFAYQLSSVKGYKKLMGKINHFGNYLDLARAENTSHLSTEEQYLNVVPLKASETVLSVSGWRGYEQGRISRFSQAVSELRRGGLGALVVPLNPESQVCFYFGESRPEEYMFRSSRDSK
jgi:hypothetical protein